MAPETNQIIFKYSKSPHYRIVAANGALGGITGRGDFRIDLFIESAELPDQVVHSLTPDGLGPEVDRNPPPNQFAREIQVGLVMQIDQARSLAHWILERLRQLDEANKKG